MTQIPILSGCYADAYANFRASYPVNLEPVIVDTGLSKGFLRSAPGLVAYATGPGGDRGAINWNGYCYRVMGDQLVQLSGGTATSLGSVDPGSPVSMDYSFTLLAIASNLKLFYWDGGAIAQVTDPDLGPVIDVIWIDGYFMTTDGTSLVVTELSDPFAVDPIKYGSSEEDPDPIVALKKVRGEVYTLNRYTIENFQNVGGNGFPFARNAGGLIPKGCVGTHACAYFLETFAFIGSGRNEALSVYLAGSGRALSISTPEIDAELAALTVAQQADIECDVIVSDDEQRLLIHLPTKTLVYYAQASAANESPVWAIRASGILADEVYAVRHFTLAEGKWLAGTQGGVVGYLSQAVETHFGATTGWQFDTTYLYNASKGCIVKTLELVGNPGTVPMGQTPTCFASITRDGRTWSQERAIPQGTFGQRNKRIQWRPGWKFENYAGLRFRGANTAIASWARLEAEIEPLNA